MLVAGELRQLGTPAELARPPADAFVAAFTGANLLPGRAAPRPGALTEVALESGGLIRSTDSLAGDVDVAIHPWDIRVAPSDAPPDPARNEIRGRITSVVRLGGRTRIRLGALTAELPAATVDEHVLALGATVCASFSPDHTTLIGR